MKKFFMLSAGLLYPITVVANSVCMGSCSRVIGACTREAAELYAF